MMGAGSRETAHAHLNLGSLLTFWPLDGVAEESRGTLEGILQESFSPRLILLYNVPRHGPACNLIIEQKTNQSDQKPVHSMNEFLVEKRALATFLTLCAYPILHYQPRSPSFAWMDSLIPYSVLGTTLAQRMQKDRLLYLMPSIITP